MNEVATLEHLCRLAADAIASQCRAIESLREARTRIEALDSMDEVDRFDSDLREPEFADDWNERIR